MRPLSGDELRASFVNASASELAEFEVPVEHVVAEWEAIDAFAWRDHRFARRGYLVTLIDDVPVGIVLRAADPPASQFRASLCNLCRTHQPANQVSLFSARKAGEAGERGDSVGTYLCTDLSCQSTVRLQAPLAPAEVRQHEAMRIDALARRTRAFVGSVLD